MGSGVHLGPDTPISSAELIFSGKGSGINNPDAIPANLIVYSDGAMKVTFSGENTQFIGESENQRLMTLDLQNHTVWKGDVITGDLSSVAESELYDKQPLNELWPIEFQANLANGSNWTGGLTSESGKTTISLDNSQWSGDVESIHFDHFYHFTSLDQDDFSTTITLDNQSSWKGALSLSDGGVNVNLANNSK